MNAYLEAAAQVIKRLRRPLKARDIISYASEWGILPDHLHGATQHKTLQARLSEEIVKNSNSSRFVRTAPGNFYLRELLDSDPDAQQAAEIFKSRPRLPSKRSENVLCIPQSAFDEFGRFQGIKGCYEEFRLNLLKRNIIEYIPRVEAETRDDLKQLITYVVIKRKNDILCFTRGRFNRLASFLRGQNCIGFGGHVTENDLTLFDFQDFGITNNAIREISEEVTLPSPDITKLSESGSLNPIGVLNDDSSLNGLRHIAIVFTYDTSSSDEWNTPQKREMSINQLRWINPIDDLPSLREFEYWSQLTMRALTPKISEEQPSYRVVRKSQFKGKHLLCVVGGIGSGKSAATKILTEDFGYQEINSGKVVAEILGIPPVPKTSRKKFQELALEFINTIEGPETLAREIIQRTKSNPNAKFVIDGIRQVETIRSLKQHSNTSKISTLYIHTPPDIAFDFYKKRESSNIKHKTFMEFYRNPVEQDLPLIVENADAVLYNWIGQNAFEKAAKNLFSELGIQN